MRITESSHAADVESLLAHLGAVRGGVIHVGAHRGQEVASYLRAGIEPVVLIEANPEMVDALRAELGGDARVRIVHCAVADRDGTIDLHVHTSRTGSVEPASILELKRFKEIVGTLHTPRSIPVPCRTLDSLFEDEGLDAGAFGLLNIDVQGAELRVLRGAERMLQSLRAVISEVSLIELYEGSAREDEIAEFLGRHGFRKVEAIYHTLYDEQSTFPAWGECLFVKERDG